LTYVEFKGLLFIAIADAADADTRGQVDIFPTADKIFLDVKEQWVSDAVTSYETQRLVFNVSRRLGPPRQGTGGIALMITGEGREQAGRLKGKSAKDIVMDAGKASRTKIISG